MYVVNKVEAQIKIAILYTNQTKLFYKFSIYRLTTNFGTIICNWVYHLNFCNTKYR